MNRFARNSIAFLVSITVFVLIVRSQLPDPPQRKKELENPAITFSGKIPDGVTYNVRVNYWTTSASFFCTDFNFGSLIPFGFGGGQGRYAERKIFTHQVKNRGGFHYAKIPIDSITGPCEWKPMYLSICLIKGNDAPDRCVQLLSRDSKDGIPRAPKRPLENKVLNLECDAPDWFTAPQDNPCYKTPIDYNDYQNARDSTLTYNFSLAPQNIEMNFDVLSIEQSKKRFDAIKRARRTYERN